LDPVSTLTGRGVRSPYLSGSYEPVQTEITAALDVVAGALPGDLAGCFVRNSSNPRFEPEGRYHWFDGDGMLHGVHLGNGTATYRNAYVRTAGLADDEAAGRCLTTGILEQPDLTRPGGPWKDTANTDLVFHAGQLLAVWWLGGEPHVIRLPDLETLGVQTYGGKRTTGLSAHPKVDPVTGEMIWFDYSPLPPYLTYGVISADGELVHQVDISLDGPRLQHDIAITERYTVLMDMSMMWDPEALAAGRVRLGFFPDKPTRFGIIPRFGTDADVRWFDASAMFMYHTVNAWEEGDEVVLVGCRIDQPFAERVDEDDPVPTIASLRLAPTFWEWRFDLRTGTTRERPLDDTMAEFPRIDNRRLGRPSRYSYHQVCAPRATLQFTGVTKYDYGGGCAAETLEYPAGWFGGETVFAPRSGSMAEDDGYLITFVAEEATGDSELYVLDAQRPADEPVCRLAVPQRVPTGYHTWWVDEAALATQRGL
jgi:carotenoid cleavage dioxygenase-like enzyme